MHPLYNTKDLTDDQLLDKLQKAYEYLSMQSSLGHTDTVESIQSVIDQLEAEKENRYYNAQIAEAKKKGDFEKSLEPITLGELNYKKETK